MKSEKFTRQIQTQKGARKGIQSLTINCPDGHQEWEEAAAQADDVHLHLRQIIEAAEKLLERVPEPKGGETLLPTASTPIYGHSGFEEAPNGTLVNSTDPEVVRLSETIVECIKHQSVIEPVSPEYFAWMAREAANAALQSLDDGDLIQAVSNAMDAVSNWHRMRYGENDELAVAIKRDNDELLDKNKGRSLHAAVAALRNWFSREHPGQSFRERWRRIPEGDSYIELAGYRVSRGEYADPGSGEIQDRNCLLIENMSDGTLETKSRDAVYRVCREIA